MHVVGHDKLQRPMIYSCFALAPNKNFQDNTEHMIECFETAVRLMPPGVDAWVWMIDYEVRSAEGIPGWGGVLCNHFRALMNQSSLSDVP